MALFFDQAWFDAQLKAVGVSRDEVAKLLKLPGEQVWELWKDQRELRAADVAALARLLQVGAAEVAKRAGISTPVPEADGDVQQRLSEMNERLTRIERMIVELKTLMLTPRS